ncbi:MAG TPA: hypothetical protein VFK78_09385 [Gemmatimonadales bacterium]|nr:hypothetical protein [Gemmatimonadales bacterium]
MFSRVRAEVVAHSLTRRVRWLALAASALVGAGLAPASALAQLAVDQTEIVLDPRAVGKRAVSFNVTNFGSEAVQATVYLQDWSRAADGQQDFVSSGTLPHSCGRFLEVFPLSLRLAPGASGAVRVALTGGDTLTAACWSIIMVESANPAPPPAGRQIRYVMRIGVKVYVVPPGLAKEGDVLDFTIARHRPDSLADTTGRDFVVSFQNSGGAPLWPTGKIEIRRIDNSVAATVDIVEFGVLPGDSRTLRVRIPALPPGHYVALALIDYGGAEVAGGQVQLDSP